MMGEPKKTNTADKKWGKRTQRGKAVLDVELSAEQAEAEGVPLNRKQKRALKRKRKN